MFDLQSNTISMNQTLTRIEKGTLHATLKTNGQIVYTCKDSAGNIVMTRKSNRKYVAAAYFLIASMEGTPPPASADQWKCREEIFYFGRKDLIGKGNSAWYFENVPKGWEPTSGKWHRKVIRAILFENVIEGKTASHAN